MPTRPGKKKTAESSTDDNVWTYEDITATAEREIRKLISSPTTDYLERRRNAGWAYGIYLGWAMLTLRRQRDGDDERLHKLTSIRDF